MKLRTEIQLNTAPFLIRHSSKIFSIGSCFAQVIGDLLLENKFKTLVNPFGTIFNPLSICKLLHFVLEKNPDMDDNLFVRHQEIWYHYDLNSNFWGEDKEQLITKIKQRHQQANHFIQESEVLILTLGTAFVYELLSFNVPVANCHKQVSSLFKKRLLKVEEVVAEFTALYQNLKVTSPEIKIILTVSPVRHIKDTITLNSISKSILRLACHEICEQSADVFYFPSYEIMLDDLRDYRFYKADMLHPNEIAENYIWEKFSRYFFDEKTLDFISKWQKIKTALQHKAFQPNSKAHQSFLKVTLKELLGLQEESNLDFKDDIDKLKEQII